MPPHLLNSKVADSSPDTSDLDLEEELALWEERDLLLARLLECKTFKDASQALKALSNDARCPTPDLLEWKNSFSD
ncbi:MAG: hypothetical protein CM15mP49_07890 [Actinomycetota bacterium]|nr:MAG: hypothetical protein CM15mP49_07890 [Actinomycetota bacterium]